MEDVGKGLFIEAAGINTHYHEDGQGEPVILIHGSGPGVSAWANWRLVFPILSKHYHLYAPDVVGFGDTDRPEGITYGMDIWIKQIVGFIESLGLKKVSIVGNSMGGGLALHLAHQRPDLINKLILMGSVGISFPLTKGLDDVWGYTPSVENMQKMLRTFVSNQAIADQDGLAEMRYKASIQPGYQESFSAMFPAPRQQCVEDMALSEEQLRQITLPTLCIHGREDQIIPIFETSWRLANILPNAELHVFSHCGHWTQIEKTVPFANVVHEFLGR
ncbi:alpha/beta hydrolase [Desulfitobacterium sp.]|uniref:alpha/beta fold hydrolase n=1 Tax=Desulfitobacterium sp. TaxID=49981 RepID=UPI002BA8B69C|nr:alpha/beta hydrolase [Desulfitobacterium sp.]HVJ49617.1 alpha/beta hydrolase [Desulfitobacterium sp.]